MDAPAPTPAPTAPAGARAGAAGRLPHLARFACDSDDPMALFPTDFVRTYADLVTTTADLDRLQRRFPDSTVELMDRGLGDPLGLANIYDVEPGALSALQAAERIGAAHARGDHWQVVYCDQNDLAAVISECAGLSYWHWIAAPGRLIVASHPSAQVQFAFAEALGVHADLSIIWDPGYRPSTAARAAALAPAPAEAPAELAAAGAVADRAVMRFSPTLHAGLNHSRGVLDAISGDLSHILGAIQRHQQLLSDAVPELTRFL